MIFVFLWEGKSPRVGRGKGSPSKLFTAESWVLGKVSQKNEIFKMAVHLSEENGAILHLSDVEKNSKELNERGKDALKPPTAASKIEILCKTLAFLIVLCLFCIHLARVLREGTVPACYFIRFSVNQTLLLVYIIITCFFFHFILWYRNILDFAVHCFGHVSIASEDR